jgi:hypothetical protein
LKPTDALKYGNTPVQRPLANKAANQRTSTIGIKIILTVSNTVRSSLANGFGTIPVTAGSGAPEILIFCSKTAWGQNGE